MTADALHVALRDAAEQIFRREAEWREHWLGLALVAAIAAKDDARPPAEQDKWRQHREAALWLARQPVPALFERDGAAL